MIRRQGDVPRVESNSLILNLFLLSYSSSEISSTDGKSSSSCDITARPPITSILINQNCQPVAHPGGVLAGFVEMMKALSALRPVFLPPIGNIMAAGNRHSFIDFAFRKSLPRFSSTGIDDLSVSDSMIHVTKNSFDECH